jgi:hypothetical protein
MDFRKARAAIGKASMMALLMAVLVVWATVGIAGLDEDLRKASGLGDLSEVNRLLAKGADVNAKDRIGSTALMCASQFGHHKVVEALLAKGADVNAKEKGYGQTALMLASMRRHPEVVQALLAKGADVNAKDKFGLTALDWAYISLPCGGLPPKPEIQEMLIKAGAKKGRLRYPERR